MKYNELILTKQKPARRSGRGISAGRGKTAGRGTKGQGSRKSPVRHGFEGGQNPLYARLPKLRGFNSHNVATEAVYTGQIDKLKSATVDTKALFEAGLISNPHARVKLILKGEITAKKQVKLQAASQKAIEAITKAGGEFSPVERLPRISKKTDKKD
jgi:large subunit ribosomal protein L15